MRRTRTLATTALLLVVALVLVSCGGDEPGTTTDGQSATGSAPAGQLTTGSTDVGTVLVDGQGMTLYMFTNDTQGETSVCEADCLEAWPPLEGEPSAGEGVDEGLLGTIERGDGSVQATYNGWPLYSFAEDEEPGDVLGQGQGGVWYALDAEGQVVKQSPAPAGGGGY